MNQLDPQDSVRMGRTEIETALLRARLARATEGDYAGDRETAWIEALTWVLGLESTEPETAWDDRFMYTLNRACGDLSALDIESQEQYARQRAMKGGD
jgi:hypothetical protein